VKGEFDMTKYTLKTIITGIILVILLVVAVKFAIRVLFPIAVVILAAYIIYMLVTKKKYG
jgi:predicted membrane protein